jgi:hypothetical protein
MKPTISKEEELEGATDPVLAMRGLGTQLWINEGGDQFVARLRAEDGWPDGEDPRLQSLPTY